MKIMENAGNTKNPRYQDLRFSNGEYEDELEIRDVSKIAKSS